MTSAAHTVVDAVYKSKPSKCSFIFCSTPAKIDPHPFGSGAAVSSKIEPPLFYFFLLFLWAWGATWCAARPRFIPVVYILIYFPSKILQRSSSRESRWEKKREKIHRPELRRVIQRKGYRMAVTCHRLNVIVVRSEWASHPPGSFFFFFFFFFWSDAQYTGRKNKQTKTSTKNALREKERES